jgi:hypothetical protein
MIYYRVNNFRVKLSSKVKGANGGVVLSTTNNITQEIRRGDAIIIKDRTYRVSAELNNIKSFDQSKLAGIVPTSKPGMEKDVLAKLVKETINIPLRAATERSIEGFVDDSSMSLPSSSIEPHLNERRQGKEFKYDFTPSQIPIEPQLAEAVDPVDAYKYGFTNDIRTIYREMCDKEKFPNTDRAKIDREVLKTRSIDEHSLNALNQNEDMKRAELADRYRKQQSAPSKQRARRKGPPKVISNEHMIKR